MAKHIIIFVLSFIFLAKGADLFVEYAARIAKRFGISDLIIGLTIAAVGTSIPELATSISASINHYSGLIIGSVIGSNIVNIGLILGISASIRPFKTEAKMYERDGYIMIASVILFFAFALNNNISGLESLIFVLSYFFYILFLVHSSKEGNNYHFKDFMKYVFDFEYVSPIKAKFNRRLLKKPLTERSPKESHSLKVFQIGLIKDFIVLILSCAAVIIGAKYLVDEAVWLARLIKLPESIIGLSLVAFGTSLPELTVSISAAKKGKGEMIIGNVLGSNIANIFLVTGVAGSIHPLAIAEISIVYTIPILLFFSLALLYFIKSDWEIKRSQGILVIAAYLLFIITAFMKGWS